MQLSRHPEPLEGLVIKIFILGQAQDAWGESRVHVMREHTGIVLKKEFPKSAKIIVLDSAEGIVAVIPPYDLCIGALIHYHRSPVRRSSIYQVETVGLPLFLGQQDILFVHHILELLFYFLSPADPVPSVFDLVHHLYTNQKTPLASIEKKVFVAKLFLLLGMYPERNLAHMAQLHKFISAPVDIIIEQGLESECEQFLNQWIRSCMALHPKIAQFKTIHFLDESRVI